jgi:hypothetical protein
MEEKIIQLKDLQPGSSYLVRARAKNRYDVYSEWSETYTLNIVKDDLKPSIPATPTVNLAGPQKIVVIHNNKTKTNVDLEFDVVSYKVFTNTTQSNTGGTLIHTMSATRPGSGIDSFATINVNAPLSGESGATIYFYVTAVDSAGNESDPSDATTGKPIQYFDSAYISDLTADRIRTGTLQANQQISVGTLAPIIIKSNADSPRGQIYIGTTNNPTGAVGSGYRDTQTAFYVDSTGKFSLKDQLYWDGTTLTIQGVLKVGEAAGDITTISGDKVRTGNLISNNYQSNIPGQPQAQSDSFTNAGTWIDLDSGAIYSKGFYITGTGDKDPDGNTIPAGTAVFGGEVFGARGIFSDYITKVGGQDLDSSDGLRFPTLVVESTNTNDGYLVLFKNAGTKSGVEFYVKQNTGDGTGESTQKNWRRASLAHLSGPDWVGGVFRVAAYASSTGKTPGLMHIYAEPGDTEPGEIHLDSDRVYISNLWIKENYANQNLSNFWKDPDTVSFNQRFFLLGSGVGSGIEVIKKPDGTPKVKIKNYEIEGVSEIIDDSKITVNTVEIGKGVGGTGKHGIKIDSSNYWYDPATLGSTDIVFRAGGSASNALTVLKNGTVTFEGQTNPTGGTIKGKLTITNVFGGGSSVFEFGKDVLSLRDGIKLNDNNYWTISQTANTANFKVGGDNNYIEWNGSSLLIQVGGSNVATQSQLSLKADASGTAIWSLLSSGTGTGVVITSAGAIYSSGKTSYNSGTAGWYLGVDSGIARFGIGSSTSSLTWDGASLKVVGTIEATSFKTITGPNRNYISMSEVDIKTQSDKLEFVRVIDENPLTPRQTGDIPAHIKLVSSASGATQTLEIVGRESTSVANPPAILLRTTSTQSILTLSANETINLNATSVLVNGSPIGSGGSSYQAGNGILIDTATNPDTISNNGYRNSTTTPTSGNKITYGGTPPSSGRTDGDIHIEF